MKPTESNPILGIESLRTGTKEKSYCSLREANMYFKVPLGGCGNHIAI
jgi:hypothetical protein